MAVHGVMPPMGQAAWKAKHVTFPMAVRGKAPPQAVSAAARNVKSY